MRKILYSTALLVLLAHQPAFGQASLNVPRVPEITASGRGDVSVTPDRAAILVSVESRAPSAAAAATANASKMAAVFKALRATGLAPAEMTTFAYSVGQDPRTMRPGIPAAAQTPIEFLARNTIRVNVRRIDDTGKAIDAALAGGATSIASVEFSSPNTDEARKNALALAVAQAQREAETLARAAGGTLGRLLSMSSAGPGAQIPYSSDFAFQRTAVGSAEYYPTMINPRDMSVIASVFGRWEFIPGPSR